MIANCFEITISGNRTSPGVWTGKSPSVWQLRNEAPKNF